MVGLGDITSGIARTQAYATSADGAVVVGDSVTASGSVAFLWTDANGMRSLKEILVNDFGLDLTSWTLSFAYGVSDDGLTIVGAGNNPNGLDEAWIATFPAPCLTDLDGSGEGNLTDFGLLVGCLTEPGQEIEPGCELADTNNDDRIDLYDFAGFLASFGCTP